MSAQGEPGRRGAPRPGQPRAGVVESLPGVVASPHGAAGGAQVTVARARGVVASPHNPLIQQIRRLAERREREARSLCVAEGPHLAAEAAAAGAEIETLVVAEGYAGGLPSAGRVVRVTRRVLESLAGTETPQGVLAVVRIPAARRPLPASAALALAADGLQDPGNLGTLLRVALAFGASAVALGPGTVDPWGGKALRAAAGATFHLPPLAVADLAAWLRQRGGTCWALAPRGGTPLTEADLAGPGPVTLVVGSEARGVSPAVAAACRPLTIPMPGPAESLNAAVAAAVAMYEAVRQGAGPSGLRQGSGPSGAR